MSGMTIFMTVVHVLLCVFMIFVILLQPGKDAGMGAAFGGGAATSAFGGRGAVTFLSKITAVCAALFFITSLALSLSGVTGSVVGTITPSSTAAPVETSVTPAAEGAAATPPPATTESADQKAAPLPLEVPGPTPAQEIPQQ